jgi:hypothetical protein
MDAILICLAVGFVAVTSGRLVLLLKARTTNGDASHTEDRH